MISILCPTRGRVMEFERMVHSVEDTAEGAVEIIGYVDEDDPARNAYEAKWRVLKPGEGVSGGEGFVARLLGHGAAGHKAVKVGLVIGKRIILTQCWNECIPYASGEIFCQGNDDVVFRSKAWDRMVEGEFAAWPDRLVMVHGDDMGVNGATAGPHPFVHRRWVEILGYFIPPYFSSDFGDSWVNELANMNGRRRFLPFQMDHLHFCVRKAGIDQTTRERLDRHKADHPDVTYRSLKAKREQDAAKLRGAMIEPVWSILILTQPGREQFLERLMKGLTPQLEREYRVEVVTRISEEGLDLGENRQALKASSRGKYVCFVDDDDRLAPNYVARILPLLDGTVDYVGFKVQTTVDGRAIPVTTHSLATGGVGKNARGNYRDISHLNPMRRELSLAVSMAGGFGEDGRWADETRRLGIVKTERFVDEVLYHYESRTQKPEVRPRNYPQVSNRPLVPAGARIPMGHIVIANVRACRNCRSLGTIVPFSNGVRCTQCGFSFAK